MLQDSPHKHAQDLAYRAYAIHSIRNTQSIDPSVAALQNGHICVLVWSSLMKICFSSNPKCLSWIEWSSRNHCLDLCKMPCQSGKDAVHLRELAKTTFCECAAQKLEGHTQTMLPQFKQVVWKHCSWAGGGGDSQYSPCLALIPVGLQVAKLRYTYVRTQEGNISLVCLQPDELHTAVSI